MIKDTNLLNDFELNNEDLNTITNHDLNEENYNLNQNNMDVYLTYLIEKIDNYCSVEGNSINAYYIPELKINLMRIVKDFPMWSNVMNNYFKSNCSTATSAPVEGYIGKLKSKFSKPLTADRFVTSHLKTIESETKISRSIQIEYRDQDIATNKHELLNTNRADVRFKDALTENNELNNDRTEKHLSKNKIPNYNGYEDEFAHYNISKDNEILKTICDDSNEGNIFLDNLQYETDIKDLLKVSQNDRPRDDIFKDILSDENYMSEDEQSE